MSMKTGSISLVVESIENNDVMFELVRIDGNGLAKEIGQEMFDEKYWLTDVLTFELSGGIPINIETIEKQALTMAQKTKDEKLILSMVKKTIEHMQTNADVEIEVDPTGTLSNAFTTAVVAPTDGGTTLKTNMALAVPANYTKASRSGGAIS